MKIYSLAYFVFSLSFLKRIYLIISQNNAVQQCQILEKLKKKCAFLSFEYGWKY